MPSALTGSVPSSRLWRFVSLALGIGANTAIFSVIDALLLKPLPVREPERLVSLGRDASDDSGTYALWRQLRERQDVFSEMFAYGPDNFDLAAGRELTPHEAAGGSKPAVINDLAARRFWPHEDPLGKRISVNGDNGHAVWRQVVGVVKTTHDQSMDLPAQPAVYLPMEQAFEPPQFLAVRTSLPIAGIAARLRQAVAAVDKDQPVYVINAMQELLDNSVAPRRLAAIVLALFGALALVLAAQRGDVLRLIAGKASG